MTYPNPPYDEDTKQAAKELLASARKQKKGNRVRHAAEMLALAILMGRDRERIMELDRIFMASFR